MPYASQSRNNPIIHTSMQELRIPLRVIFYREDGAWIAHSLEFDLVGDGDTPGAALSNLSEAIQLQVRAAIDCNNMKNLFKPADGKFFAMFAAGKKIVAGEIHLKLDSVSIDDTETREYCEANADSGDLAFA